MVNAWLCPRQKVCESNGFVGTTERRKGLLLQGTRLVITRDSLRLHGEGVCKGEVGDHYGKVRDYKG